MGSPSKFLFFTLFTFKLNNCKIPFHSDMSELISKTRIWVAVVRIDLHKDRCVLNLVQNVLIQGI